MEVTLTIGYCDFDKGGVLYQASTNVFPDIIGLGSSKAIAIKDLDQQTQKMYYTCGQGPHGSVH